MNREDSLLLRRAAELLSERAEELFDSEVDGSGPHKGKVTNRFRWEEILEKRSIAKKLKEMAKA